MTEDYVTEAEVIAVLEKAANAFSVTGDIEAMNEARGLIARIRRENEDAVA